MIRVRVYQNSDKVITGFDMNGHAGYAESGGDIICAAASMLVINTVNSLETLTKAAFGYDTDEPSGTIHFRFSELPSPEAQLLVQSMVLGLQTIAQDYGTKYIKIRFEEVQQP